MSQQGLALISGAGLGSLITYLITHPHEAQAAPAPEGVDPETWNAIITIIQSIQEQNERLESALSQVVGLMGAGGVQLDNPATFGTGNVVCGAAGQSYQIPKKLVPYDKELVVKAWPTNTGNIYIANNEVDAVIVTAAYPLLPNEAVGLKVHWSDVVWLSAQVAGEGASFIVEQN